MERHQIVVKSEMETDGELLVFYVDENGTTEEGVVTSIENIVDGNLDQLQQGSYIIEDVGEQPAQNEPMQIEEENTSNDKWLDEETKRLLIFYIDNKVTFLSGATMKKHLWTVACKTMLTGKTPTCCEIKLRNLKKSYSVIRLDQAKGKNLFLWPYYELCHQAFHDDAYVNMLLNDAGKKEQLVKLNEPATNLENDGILIKKVNSNRSVDEAVEKMLNLYLKHKKANKDTWQRHLWDIIAIELGEDGEYWHKRFLNFKQHYIRMLEKRTKSGSKSVNWPYMHIFDEIFETDVDFQRKYGSPKKEPVTIISDVSHTVSPKLEWDDTEKTVLAKYCFDCFDEFQDATIPNSFLWNEVGRLLDKTADVCKKKYVELKQNHLEQYISGGYDMRNRIPIAILFDNIISREIERQLSNILVKPGKMDLWETEEIDILVQFFYDNLEMFKDPICHYVCWAAASRKLNQNVLSCKYQWLDLTTLYKSILDDKKEDPDMEIDWRYIELFDRIFDYGMDTELLDGYEKYEKPSEKKDSGKICAKKLNIKLEENLEVNDDEEEYDERGFIKRSRGIGDSKQIKILEFFQKNKDKFATSKRKKLALWGVLAEQIGITAEQCAHRFRNLKQVYTAYIQREINKPEMPILWPYYTLCKKVFGYRAIKNKLRNSKVDSDDIEEWTPKDIKLVIKHFSKNFNVINGNADDKSIWSPLAQEISRSDTSCRDKLLELRKSYKKVKMMISRNPDCKINWKYFKLFEEIYTGVKVEEMEVDSDDDRAEVSQEALGSDTDKKKLQEDEDYQCIIVMSEGGEELTESVHQSSEIILKVTPVEAPVTATTNTNEKRKPVPWTSKERELLLNTYLNYIKANKGTSINTEDMWKEIAKKFPKKSPIGCRRKYIKMRNDHKKNANDERYKTSLHCELFKQIFAVKPKFTAAPIDDCFLRESQIFKDVTLPIWKVEQALKYYLEHLEEFISPRYEKKYVWKELSNATSLPLYKTFKKINYLKQVYRSDTSQVLDKNAEALGLDFSGLLKQIFEKEFAIKIATYEPKPQVEDESETSWSDEETEQLLNWYLENLSKFKNPKFVPSYLWMDAAEALNKSALACSKKMSEIRTRYSGMVKETPEALVEWKFHELCQKIYGTGKKSTPVNSD